MVGQTLSQDSKWYTEPLKRIRNAIAAVVVIAGVVVAAGNEALGVVPASMRDEITSVIGIATVIAALAVIVQGKLGRDGVPGTKFNGMLSPEHTHQAMVQSAQPAPATPADPVDHLASLGVAIEAAPVVAPPA